MNYPFLSERNRRATYDELIEWAAKEADGRLVEGFKDISFLEDAKVYDDRTASPLVNGSKEIILPMNSKNPFRILTAPVPETINTRYIIFVFVVGFGNGSVLPQASGYWEIYVNKQKAVSIRKVNYSQVFKHGECMIAYDQRRLETAPPYTGMTLSSGIKNESQASFGTAFLKVPASWCKTGKPVEITFQSVSKVPSTQWLAIYPTYNAILRGSIQNGISMLAGKDRYKTGYYNIYFGDIHTHSGQVQGVKDDKGCGIGTWRNNYEHARETGAMDFYALTDHEYQFEGMENEYFSLADEFNDEGEFVTLKAFEHTSLLYGHRNVYFLDDAICVNTNKKFAGGPSLNPEENIAPDELFHKLSESKLDFFTVPHHPSSCEHPFCWDYFNPKYDRLVEVYSCWGSSDYYGDFPRGMSDRHERLFVNEAVKSGLRFGLIASSDGHDGYSGYGQSPYSKHHHLFHYCGSGRTAVYAGNLTRKDVYEALYDRRCYATTGAPILLHVLLNDTMMGRGVKMLQDEKPVLSVSCRGTTGIKCVIIMKDGEVAHTHWCHSMISTCFEWCDEKFKPGDKSGYYVRVIQDDYESAWSSVLWTV